MATTKQMPAPRTLQEWMERTGTHSTALLALVKERTGHSISPTMMSFILKGSRRCSHVNAQALSIVTGVPFKTLIAWPRVSDLDKSLGRRSRHVA